MWYHESRSNYTFVKSFRPRKFRSDAFLFWSRGPDSYRKNDRKRAVVWPWLVLQLSTVLALTQLGIRQSDWRRAGIRSTNLHIVVEFWIITYPLGIAGYIFRLRLWNMEAQNTCLQKYRRFKLMCCFDTKVQSSAVIKRSNMVRFCINNCRNWDIISIRCWIHKRHPIPRPNGRAMGCLLWIFVIKLTAL